MGVATEVVTVTLLDDQEREGTRRSSRGSYATGETTLADQRGAGVIVDGDWPDSSGRRNTNRAAAWASLGCGPYR